MGTLNRTDKIVCFFVCWSALILSFVLPYNGTGISMCFFNQITHIPCPGCGMTRSIINISHFNFYSAYLLNPFGYLFYFAFLAGAIWSTIPSSIAIPFANKIIDNKKFKYLIVVILVSFLFFGIARAFYYLFNNLKFY